MHHVSTLPLMTLMEIPEADPVEHPKSARKLIAKEKARVALEARRRGHSWEGAAQIAGYKNGKTAARAAKRLMEKQVSTTVDEYRSLMIDRCNEMLVGLADKADEGNERAIETSLKVMDRLDKLVQLPDPQHQHQVEHHHTLVIESSTEDDYVRRLSALAPRQIGSSEPAPEGMVANPFAADVIEAEGVELT